MKNQILNNSRDKNRRRLGDFLRERRKLSGLSQADLAHKLGYESPQFISDWERGVFSPPMKKLVMICKVLKADPDQFFKLLLRFSVERLENEMVSDYETLVKKSRSAR